MLSETYYHGIVERQDVEQLLTKDGDFLICIPEEDEKPVKHILFVTEWSFLSD